MLSVYSLHRLFMEGWMGQGHYCSHCQPQLGKEVADGSFLFKYYRKAIRLNENEGIYIRNVQTGQVY